MRAISAAGRAWMPCACATTSDSLTTGAAGRRHRRAAPRSNSSSSNSASPLERTIEARVCVIRKRSPLVMIDRRHEAGRLARHAVEIEGQQQIAGTHAVAFAHVHLESLASQRHGVDAHVEQNFSAGRGTQRQRVARRGDRDDFAVAGSAQFRCPWDRSPRHHRAWPSQKPRPGLHRAARTSRRTAQG